MHKTEVQRRFRSVQKAIKKYSIKLNKFMLPLVTLLIVSSFLAGRLVTFELLNTATPVETTTPVPSITIKTQEPSPTPTPSPSPVYTYMPTPLTPPQSSSLDVKWGETKKIDEHLSVTRFGRDDHMSTVDELNQAMNQYRQAHNLPTLNFDGTLCSFAQTRVNQLLASGKFSHEGFSELVDNQDAFSYMSEVLFDSKGPTAGVHIIEWGWDKSLTGHKEAISNPRWHEGCGGIAGYYAVFIFGER